jgi:hypothetical protein
MDVDAVFGEKIEVAAIDADAILRHRRDIPASSSLTLALLSHRHLFIIDTGLMVASAPLKKVSLREKYK